jgi:hypothetical protein
MVFSYTVHNMALIHCIGCALQTHQLDQLTHCWLLGNICRSSCLPSLCDILLLQGAIEINSYINDRPRIWLRLYPTSHLWNDTPNTQNLSNLLNHSTIPQSFQTRLSVWFVLEKKKTRPSDDQCFLYWHQRAIWPPKFSKVNQMDKLEVCLGQDIIWMAGWEGHIWLDPIVFVACAKSWLAPMVTMMRARKFQSQPLTRFRMPVHAFYFYLLSLNFVSRELRFTKLPHFLSLCCLNVQ